MSTALTNLGVTFPDSTVQTTAASGGGGAAGGRYRGEEDDEKEKENNEDEEGVECKQRTLRKHCR